uniref:Uncharacterized protein n=1 Tax=Panagrolaimus superbus TaxID=310955 RepID=A0A914YN43_9BILA
MSFNYSLPPLVSLKAASIDQTYLQQIKKLEQEIKALKNLHTNAYHKNIYLLLNKFAENFLMPSEYWTDLFETMWRFNFNFDKNYITSLSKYHFYNKEDDKFSTTSNISYQKVLSNPKLKFLTIFNEENEHKSGDRKNFSPLIQILQYPNCDIEQVWALYESEIYTFPAKNIVEIYQKMKDLYFKIKSMEENNVFEWFNILFEVGDDEFVIDNVENRLGKDLTNKILWKLYIKFWEKRDKKTMLHIYSKYCRIFPGQKSIKNEYEKEVKKFGPPLIVPWKNAFSFEKYVENFDFNTAVLQKKQQKNVPMKKQKHLKPCDRYFIFENAVMQKFSFRQTFINYIFDNANPEQKQKLLVLCKFFFLQNPIQICYKFIVQQMLDQSLINFCQNSVTVDPTYLQKANFTKICISTVFNFTVCDNHTALSAFIPKILKCSAKFVTIRCQKLTLDEIKVIIGDGNVEEILLQKVDIFDKINQRNVPIEEILELTPKLKKLTLPSYPVTTAFIESLINIPFENKLDFIDFQNVRGSDFDANIFLQFLLEKMKPKCKINFFFQFAPGFTLDEMYEMSYAVKDMINKNFGYDGDIPYYIYNYDIQ